MGSDYPFPLGEMPTPGDMIANDKQVAEMFSESERAQMLGINVLEFLGIAATPYKDNNNSMRSA